MPSLLGKLLLLALAGCFLASGAQAQILVFPRGHCVEIDDDGTRWARFGYINIASSTVTIPRGTDNFFVEPPQNRGQPNTFEPGVHLDVFRTGMGTHETLRWVLEGQIGVALFDEEFLCSEAEEPEEVLAVAVFGEGKVTDDSGSLNCPLGRCLASYPQGSLVELVAEPAKDFVFEGWGGDPGCTDGTVSLTRSRVCTATFVEENPPVEDPPVALGLAVFGGGTLASDAGGLTCPPGPCIGLLPAGTVATLTATPDPGYVMSEWGGDPGCEDGVVTLWESLLCTAVFSRQASVLDVPAADPLALTLLALLLAGGGLWFLRR